MVWGYNLVAMPCCKAFNISLWIRHTLPPCLSAVPLTPPSRQQSVAPGFPAQEKGNGALLITNTATAAPIMGWLTHEWAAGHTAVWGSQQAFCLPVIPPRPNQHPGVNRELEYTRCKLTNQRTKKHQSSSCSARGRSNRSQQGHGLMTRFVSVHFY